MEWTDLKLIQLCKNNKREGYGLLFQKYEKYLYKLCYYYTHSPEDSRDLMQEIYIKIFQGIQNFDSAKPVLPWLKRIAVNTCLNFIRDYKLATVSMSSSVDGADTTLEQLLPAAENVEDQVTYLDTRKLVQEAMAELPGEMKMTVILRHLEGRTYNEIGELLDLPVGTVKTHLFRGRKILRDKLLQLGLWEV